MMWLFVAILLLFIALLVYFNEGGRATVEIFVVIALFVLFVLWDLWMISAAIMIVWMYNKFFKRDYKR